MSRIGEPEGAGSQDPKPWETGHPTVPEKGLKPAHLILRVRSREDLGTP